MRIEGKRLVTLDANPFELTESQYDIELESFNDLSESQDHGVPIPSGESPLMNFVFQCGKCTYQSQSKVLMDRHSTRHLTDQPFECPTCDYSVVDHLKFVDHLRIHQKSNVIQCPFCPFGSNALAMELHMLKHRTLEIFDCSSCEFSSNSVKSMNHHNHVYHDQMFKCEYCKKYMTKHSLIKHWDEVHGIREVTANATDPDTPWGVPPLSRPGSGCSVLSSDIIPKTEGPLEIRFPTSAAAHNLHLAEVNDEFGARDFSNDEIETFSCQVCEFSSHLKVVLKYHILNMHTNKVKCMQCSVLMTKHALIQHSKNAHGIHFYFDGKGLREANLHSNKLEDPHSSSKDFPKSRTLVRNPKEREIPAKILRSGDRFTCSICKYSGPNKVAIMAHIDNLHKRKYFCSKCPMIMTKFALVEHARLMHGETLKIKNRYIIEAKPNSNSGSGFEEDNEKGSEVEVEKAYECSKSMQHDVSRIILQRGNNFYCSICQYSKNWRPQVESHIEKLHVKKFHCKHCPEVMNKFDLIEHSMAVHGVTMSIKTPGLKEFRQEVDWATGDLNRQSMDIHEVGLMGGLPKRLIGNQELDEGSQEAPDLQIIHQDLNVGKLYSDYDPSNSSRAVGGGHSHVSGCKPGRPFACPICDFASHNEWSLTCHMKLLHTVKYHCSHCSEIMTKYEMAKHCKNKHGIEIPLRGPSGLKEARENPLTKGKVQNLSIAEETSFVGDQFLGHFMDGTQTSMPIKHQGAMDTNDPTSCSICGFIGKYPSDLSMHLELFHQKKFCCPQCPAVMSKHELIDHSWTAHGVVTKPTTLFLKEVAENDTDGGMSDDDDPEYEPSLSLQRDKDTSKKFSCPHCDHVARASDKIKVHIERMHTRKFHCEHCTVVMFKYDLIQHYANEHRHFLSHTYRSYKFKRADESIDVQVSHDQTCQSDREHSKYDTVSSFLGPKVQSVKENVECEESSFRQKNPSKDDCSICGYDGTNLEVHMERLHKMQFRCRKCTTTLTKYELIKHYRSVHNVAVSRFGNFINFTDAVKSPIGDPGAGKLDAHRMKEFREDSCENLDGPVHSFMGMSDNRAMDDSGEIGEDQMESFQLDSDYSESEELSSRDSKNASKNVCPVCDYVAAHNSHMQTHMERLHRKRYHCEHCPAIMTKHELVEHYKITHDITISKYGVTRFTEASTAAESQSGNSCPPAFAVKSENYELFHHDSSSSSTGGGTIICPICEFSTKTERILEAHIMKWHRCKYVCDNCPEIMSKHEMIEHSRKIHGIILPKVGRPMQLLKLAEQDEDLEYLQPTTSSFIVQSSGELKCNECGFSSQYRKSMVDHVVSLHRKKYSCNHCSTILTKHELIRHAKSLHGIDIPYNGRGYVFRQVTQDCSNNFKNGDDSVHQMSYHENNGMEKFITQGNVSPTYHKCTYCEFTTLYPYNLKSHAESYHTKLFHCNTCPEIMTKYELILHYKNEHCVFVSTDVKTHRGPRFMEYHPRQTEHERNVSSGTDHYGCAENIPTVSDNGGPELINSVSACARLTSAPEISLEQEAVDFEQFISADEQTGVYSCGRCDFSSYHKSALQPHIERFHKKKFSCDFCSAVMSKYDLIQHYKDVHNVTIKNQGRGYSFKEVSEGAEQLNNTVDDSEFARSASTRPRSTIKPEISYENVNEQVDSASIKQNGGDFICSSCGFSSKYRYSLECHLNSLHRKKYGCRNCSVVSSKFNLIQHYKAVHGTVILNSGRGPTSDFFRDVSQDSEKCSETYIAPHSGGLNDRSLNASEINDDDNNVIKVGGEYKCALCDHSSAWNSRDVKVHFQSMHKKKFSCNQCSVILTKYEMIQHYQADHDLVISTRGLSKYFTEVDDVTHGVDESVFTENVAESSIQGVPSTTEFSTDGEVQSMNIIEEDGEFKCSICGVSSAYKFNMKAHFESLHQKKYSCNRCSIVMTKYEMIQHYEADHHLLINSRGFSKYVTEIDNVTYGMDESVNENVVESSIQGVPSTMEFSTDGEVQRMDIIEEGGEFKCSICGVSSAYKCNMKAHLESLHQKKYSCNRCSVVMTKYEMMQHYETDHDLFINTRGFSKYVTEVDNVTRGMDEWAFAENVAERSIQGGSSTTEFSTDGEVWSMSIIEEGGEFRCTICGVSSAYKFNMKAHFENFHQKKFSCNRCSVVTTKYDMVCHYETSHRFVIPNFGKGNLRPYCRPVEEYSGVMDSPNLAGDIVEAIMDDRSTSEVDDNAAAMVETVMDGPSRAVFDEDIDGDAVKIISEGGKHSCSICGCSSTYKGNVQAHIKALHQKKYSCSRCSLITTKYDMMRHFETEHDTVIENMGKGNLGAYFKAVDEGSQSMQSVGSSVFADDIQDGHWITGTGDGGNMRIIQEGGIFKCSTCGYAGPKGSVKAHISILHEKKYSCNQCSSVLTKYEMIQHYETDHNVVISSKGSATKYFREVGQDSEILDSSVLGNSALKSSVIDSTCRTELVIEGEDFKCSLCHYSSDSKQNAESHLKSHHKSLYSCNQCSAVMTKYEMVKHYETDHSVEIPDWDLSTGSLPQYFIAVDEVPRVTLSSSVAKADDLSSRSVPEIGHSTSETGTDAGDVGFALKKGGEFRCSICDYSHRSKVGLETHMASLHKKKFSCNRCSVVTTKYDMMQHFKTVHGVEILNKGRGVTMQYFTAVDQDPGMADHSESYQPAQAVSTSAIENDMEMPMTGSQPSHALDDTPAILADEGTTFSAGDSQENENLSCKICDFSTKHSTSMEMHMVNMHQKKFACKQCPAVLTKYTLIKHCNNFHNITISAFNGTLQEVKSPLKGPADSELQESGLPTSSSAMKNVSESNRVNIEDPGRSNSSDPVIKGSAMFKCLSCDFSSRLRIHLQVHTKNMHTDKHNCNLCSAVMTKHELLSHCENIHKALSSSSTAKQSRHDVGDDVGGAMLADNCTQECIIVEQSGTSAAVIDLTDNQNQFKCSLCEFSTHLRHSLLQHMELLHTKKYHCDHCTAIMTKHELMSHNKSVHGVVIGIKGYRLREAKADMDDSKECDDVSDAEVIQARKTFSCQICDFTTKAKWYLKDHMEKFHRKRYRCTHCPAVMARYDLTKHCKMVHGVTFSSRLPLTEADELNDVSSPAEESPKNLNFGGLSSSSGSIEANTVKSHTTQDHSQEVSDNTQCPKCDYSTPHKWYMKDHIQNLHKKKHTCKHCSAVMTKYELRTHSMERHGVDLKIGTKPSHPSCVGAKPGENQGKSKYNMSEFKKPKRFPCDHCPFSSFHPFGLKRHIKLQHTIKYPCPHCPAMLTRYFLIKHCRNVHNTQIPDGQPGLTTVDDLSTEPATELTRESSSYSFATQESTSHIVNPKFHSQQPSASKVIQSSTLQPMVVMEKLPIDTDDLDSTFSVISNTKPADPAIPKNLKFEASMSQP